MTGCLGVPAISLCHKSFKMFTLQLQTYLTMDLLTVHRTMWDCRPHKRGFALNPFSIPDIYQAISRSILGDMGTTDIQMTGLKPLSHAEVE